MKTIIDERDNFEGEVGVSTLMSQRVTDAPEPILLDVEVHGRSFRRGSGETPLSSEVINLSDIAAFTEPPTAAFSGLTGAMKTVTGSVEITATALDTLNKWLDDKEAEDAATVAQAPTLLQRKAIKLAMQRGELVKLQKICQTAVDWATEMKRDPAVEVKTALETYISLYGTPELNDISWTAQRKRAALMSRNKRKAYKKSRRR